ncbi:hypothetical protein [Paenibacillus guangzhouensis]|uniref:hypothetical protein n=1 Tax=Paenibacillus guangzhouensis TaxID=1473112 RepID=UPI001266C21F|nr:hypothetical protein [Paenibacillus guangzhouensis]
MVQETVKWEERLLEEGLEIIALCKAMTQDVWHAHYGAAGIASYFFVKENPLPDDIRTLILDQATKMLKTHTFGKMTEDESQIKTYRYAEQQIISALERTIHELHWVGHHVIYSAIALLAIRELEAWGTESQIDGIVQLVRSFENTIPGRSWFGLSTKEVKKLGIDADDVFPQIHNPSDLSAFVLSELAAFEVIYHAEAHHDLIGHMLTFAHALNILHDLGYESLFHKGLHPLFKMVKVLRMSQNMQPDDNVPLFSPVDRLPMMKKQSVQYLPLEKAFWTHDHQKSDWDFGHVFKFTYSYYNHVKRVPRSIGEASQHNFRYVISL